MKKGVISHPVQPLEGYILIEKSQDKQYGGYITKAGDGMSDVTGKVLVVGKEKTEYLQNGDRVYIEAPCKVGDTIVHKNLAGITIEGYKLINFEDIVGIINER